MIRRALAAIVEAWNRRRGHWIYDVERESNCLVRAHCACGGSVLVWHSRARGVALVMHTTCAAALRRWQRDNRRVPPAIACWSCREGIV